ncbi:MAG: ketopantoate reductase family protein [Thermoleophilia bacterium]
MDNNSNAINKVCIYGAGGVGGYFGGKITDVDRSNNAELEVYFIARGKHLDAIKSDGIRVFTPERTIIGVPTMATDDLDEIPSPDLFLLCVKSYDLDNVVKAISSKVSQKTVIVPLLNGADVYERIRANLDKGIVLPACVYVGTHIERPGVISQNGGEGTILFGKDPQLPQFTPEKVMNFFTSVGINSKLNDDPSTAIWGKYIFIAAFGLVTVFTGKTLGEIMADRDSMELVRKVMLEIKAIAEGKSIVLPENIIEGSINKARNFPYETKTSYQRDVELKGSVNEGDLYGGTILREGAALGIPTPETKSIYSEIQHRFNG